MCNGYLLPGIGGEWVAVDAPGGFASWVQSHLPSGARLSHLLLTHQHFDHIEDAHALQAATGCRICACMPYSPSLTLAEHAASWGLPVPPAFRVDEPLGEQDSTATWGGLSWRVLHVPGHSADGMAYALPESGLLFTGDALFSGSIGRTDLPGGNAALLVRHIRTKLLTLPPGIGVYPGHGPASSVGDELLNNPFIQG